MKKEYSRSYTVATIGPASGEVETLKKMIAHRMDLARLNFSHGTHETHAKYIAAIREASKLNERYIPIIQDLSGPREKTDDGHQLNKELESVITDKDKEDLKFGLEQNVDYVALSYVSSGKDVIELRDLMEKYGKVKPIIAKIERPEAIPNLDDIIEKTDAVMVARGDLGNSMPLEQLPFLQAMIVKKCNKAQKPVIVATQMMLSMVNSPTPTRAEVTDVSNAILQGADGVMLSEETTIGKYPVQTVEMMEKIVLEAEKYTNGRLPNKL
ncbi:MAG: pyruvate kinase [bacterium]